jgi:hypothetical protein
MFNKFVGAVPPAVLRLSSLQTIFLNNNNLTGSIDATDVSPSVTSCIVQGYADVADSNCLSACQPPCCRSENAACAPRNDDCMYPRLLDDIGTTTFSTFNATARTCIGCTPACVIRRDVWFEWHATCTGSASIEICDVENVALLIYDNEACPPRTGNTGSDSECVPAPKCANGMGARLQRLVTIGQVLWVRVGSLVPTAGFEATISLDCQGTAPSAGNGKCAWWAPPATTSTFANPTTIATTTVSTATTTTTSTTATLSTTSPPTTTSSSPSQPSSTTSATATTTSERSVATATTGTTSGSTTMATPTTTSLSTIPSLTSSATIAPTTTPTTTTTTTTTPTSTTTSATPSATTDTNMSLITSSAITSSTSTSGDSTGSASVGEGANQSDDVVDETLSPAALNGIIGGGVALVALLCIALIVTTVMLRRAARANERDSQRSVPMRDQFQPAASSNYDRFHLPAETVEENSTHYQSLAPQEA